VTANTEHDRIADTVELDLAGNRLARKYSERQQLLRVLWMFGVWLIRLSPRPFFGWRRFVLRLFGARIGRHVHISMKASH
jgi:putative colanic acid biosynthesis acetyltransferase WcaF